MLWTSVSPVLAETETTFQYQASETNEHSLQNSRNRWFGIFFKEKRVGYMHHVLSRSSEERPTINSTLTKVIEIEGGVKISVREDLRFDAAAPHRLRNGHYQMERGDEVLTSRYVLDEEGATVHRIDGKKVRSTAIEPLDYSLDDYLALERCLQSQGSGCPINSLRTLHTKNFTVSSTKARIAESSATESAKFAGAAFQVSLHNEVSAFDSVHYLAENGRPEVIMLGGHFRAKHESREQAQEYSQLPDPIALSSIEIKQQLQQPDTIRRLVLEATGPLESLLRTSSRQRLRKQLWSENLLLEMSDFSDGELIEEGEGVENYLGETHEYPVKDPRIIELVSDLTANARSDSGKLVRLLKFVFHHLKSSERAHLSVISSLEERRGNCRDRARLFTTLARTAGIPAREVAGLVYDDETKNTFSPHSWNEVLVAGRWLSLDPTFNRAKLNPTYISFGSGSKGLQNLITAMGRISLRVVSVSYDEI